LRATSNVPSKAQAARHARILEETKRLIVSVGADGITMRDLAAASGVAHGTLYNRFGGKDQLISQAVLDHYEKVIRSRLNNYAGARTPLDKVLVGIDLIASDCERGPAFGRALMSAYFKVKGEGRQLIALYQALYSMWLPVIVEMQQRGLLRPWIAAPALCTEMCEREFGTVMKWAQGDFAINHLRDRTTFSVLMSLLGASRGRQATQIETMLETSLSRIGRTFGLPSP